MFFESEDLNFKILSVLYDERRSHNGSSGMRPFSSLSFRIKGDAFLTCNNKNYYLTDNDLLLCPKECPYDIDTGNENLFVVHFDTDNELPKTLKKLTVSNPEIYRLEFYRLYSAWNSKRSGYQYECKYIFYKILMNIQRENTLNQNNTNQITTAIEYIHDHFCDGEISISKLANLCSVSDTYFRKLFKEKTGITPLKYINRLRSNKAVELLQSGFYTVTEVSAKCGFENVYYFSLFIKKETGKNPSQIIGK